MTWTLRYAAAFLPAVFTVGGWRWAVWAYEHFGCQGNLKSLEPCFAGSYNILPWLGFGLFWCQLLAWLAVPLSIGLLIVVGLQHKDEKKRKSRS